MKIFDKYSAISPDYHYRQIDRRFFRYYNASLDARFKTLVDTVKIIAKCKKLKLLDIGCGDGVALYLINKAMPLLELYGVDEVEIALNVARTKIPDGKIERASAYELPYAENYFDIVISSDVIEHLEKPEAMLNEIKRVAKTGATIIIGTPVRRAKQPIDSHHVQEFFQEDFMVLMSNFFTDCQLHESHNLIPTLLYNSPTRSFLNFKYAINLLTILGLNPFLSGRKNLSQMFAYMYVICKK